MKSTEPDHPFHAMKSAGGKRRSGRTKHFLGWRIHCSMRLLFLAPLLVGCASFNLSSKGPLRTQTTTEATASSCVVVMLPGIGDSPEKFRTYGFEAAVTSSETPCRVVLVDAHFGYYQRPELPGRLASEVLQPLRAQYESVWLVGVSLGGYGAALTAAEFPGLVDGVVLISPFLGVPTRVKTLTTRIEQGGGLDTFAGDFGSRGRPERHLMEVGPLWKWLAERARSPEQGTELRLGYGEQDRFVAAQRVLAGGLDDSQTITVTGGHSWDTFGALFKQLARSAPWATGKTFSAGRSG